MKTITKAQYLQVVGLLALTEHHTQRLNDIQTSLEDLLDEHGEFSHITDAIYDDGCRDADDLLKRLKIEVVS